jgi:NAD(P)-dependent dehydrogenase (short-subunit alcohol dehydrogenase family)
MSRNTDSATKSKGLIVCTASNAGLYPFAMAPMYAATKSGVIGLVRSLAKPLELEKIQINALAPAVIGMFGHKI